MSDRFAAAYLRANAASLSALGEVAAKHEISLSHPETGRIFVLDEGSKELDFGAVATGLQNGSITTVQLWLSPSDDIVCTFSQRDGVWVEEFSFANPGELRPQLLGFFLDVFSYWNVTGKFLLGVVDFEGSTFESPWEHLAMLGGSLPPGADLIALPPRASQSYGLKNYPSQKRDHGLSLHSPSVE